MVPTAGGEVPGALRRWFVVHFVIDWLFALPLLVVPEAFLGTLGWTVVDLCFARTPSARQVVDLSASSGNNRAS